MIHSILTNPTYTGDLAQGRSRVKSYKVHQIEAVPREEWVEVAGTHAKSFLLLPFSRFRCDELIDITILGFQIGEW